MMRTSRTRVRPATAARSLLWAVLAALLATGLGVSGAVAQEPVERVLCVFDPSGAVGDAYREMEAFRAAALEWGVRFTLRPYTDERTASEDFNAGICNAVLLTGVRARQYNRFSGTVEAMGAVESYEALRQVLALLANPRAAARMASGSYETFTVFPAGAVYLFLRDRSLSSISELAGKRIATIDFDQAAVTMVDRVGASMVPADIGTFAGMFNNGSVNVCYAPATAYRPLELERGLQSGGGVVRYPLSQLTLQIIGRPGDFPEGFGNSARAYAFERFDAMLALVGRSDAEIAEHYWVDVASEARSSYDDVFRQVRLQLRDEGVYDGTMLTLLRRVRCQLDESRAECADQLE
jgi:hypothetical protein